MSDTVEVAAQRLSEALHQIARELAIALEPAVKAMNDFLAPYVPTIVVELEQGKIAILRGQVTVTIDDQSTYLGRIDAETAQELVEYFTELKMYLED